MTVKNPIKHFAQLYLDQGWKIVPLAPKSKRVTKAGWIGLEFTVEDFEPGDNIGLRSVSDGSSSLVFVDLDSPEAVAMANYADPILLPPTSCVYGRPSKPRSKRIYVTTPPIPKTIPFKDFDRTMLVEIRSNHQDMAPPSVHPSGEVLAWDSDIDDPAEVDAAVLLRRVKLLATAVILGRHYAPPGARHEWTLALAGTLKQRGVTEEELIDVITAAALWSQDPKRSDRLSEVSSTFGRSDDDPITGATRLKELATEGLVEGLKKLWGRAPSTSGGEYALNSRGFPDARNVSNILIALDKVGATLTYDEFACKPFLKYHGTSALLDDDSAIDLWLEIDRTQFFRPTKDLFIDVLKSVARHSSFHPVLEYFKTLHWDGIPRLDTWLTTCAQAVNTPYTRAVSALVLMAAVRRVRQPGCKFDEMLILESPQQGLLKSTAIRTLCHDPAWFSEDLPLDADSQRLIESTSGKMILEASELSGMRASQHESLKSMLSRAVDGPVRMAYGRLAVEKPRSWVIIGTTNSSSYLSDLSGNRRYWPIAVQNIDITWIRDHRDHLWAEACAREANGESIRLDPSLWKAAAAQQSARVYSHPWVEALVEEYATKDPGIRVTREELFEFLTVPLDRRKAHDSRIISSAMESIGYEKISIRQGKHVVNGWGRN
jgi:hypothetical protein